ncbi:MAG: Trm112 family protein [Acidobacteria bacterium]|nr:Trm112 family protein [Acidobacteriota bacterium]
MAVDSQLLDILVCPVDHSKLEVVELPGEVRARLVTTYREQFKDEDPVVEIGLACTACGRVYPVVSDIPVMLSDEALGPDEVKP